MSDYNKQTVANLRQLLKDRGIPSTGLTRKAQIIEKLEEWDVKESASAEAEESAQDVDANAAVNEEATIEGGIENGDEASRQAESSMPIPTEDANPSQDVEPEAPAVIAPAPDVVVEHVEVDTGLERQAPEADVSEQPQPEPTNIAVEDTPVPMDDAQPAIVAQPVEPSPILDSASTEQIVPDEKPPAIAQLVETSHTPDVASTEQTPSSAPDEEPSIEKVQLLPIPERSATTTAEPGTRLNTEELEAETRKRKRRSQTPELTSQDVRVKKSRPDNDNAPDVLLQEDKAEDMDTVMEQRAPEAEEKEVDQEVIDTAMNGDTQASAQPEPHTATTAEDSRSDEATPAVPVPEKKEKAPRFRELLKPVDTMESTAPNTSSLVPDDRPIVPALHVATPAVYIRDLMRPLRPDQLRAHLISLASPPSGSPNPSIIKSMFLDGMKSHAFVQFTNITAASRVRASLHGSIWPPEGNRKELWVDFVPDDKVQDWIQQEEDSIAADKAARSSGRPAAGQRFEVVYPSTEDGTGVEAIFQVVGSAAPAAAAPVASSSDWNPPTSPHHHRRHQSPLSPSQRQNSYPPATAEAKVPPAVDESRQHNIAKSFQTLDDLFSSTQTAKPKLYFKPVSAATAELRLDELDRETARDWVPTGAAAESVQRKGRGMRNAEVSRKDEMVRYSFDERDGERVVEIGVDYGGEQGGGGFGGRGGGGGGSHWGRGGGGGGGRGRGVGFGSGAWPRGGGNWRGGGGGGDNSWRSGN